MAIIESINNARGRGATDEQIIKEIATQNPEKAVSFQEAQTRGAGAKQILSEIIKQNYKPTPVQQPKQSFFDKIPTPQEVGLAHPASAALGFMSRAVQVPSALIGITGKTIANVGAGIKEGNLGYVGQSLKQTGKELIDIPRDVAMGVKEGFLEKADMTSIFETMREAGVPKVPAFIAEIIGDPLNLIGVGKADDAYKLTQKSLQSFKKGLLEKTASKLYQSLGLSVKNATDEFLKIGNKIKGKVIEIPQLLGDELAQYGIKGSFEEMILQMKQKLPALTKNLRLILKKTSDKVDLNPIVKNLQALYNRAMMTGQDDVANAIYEATGRFVNRSGVGDDGLLDAIKSLDLKLVYDNARLTATKKLSDADDILKIIADGLREQINDISGAGKYNSEMSSYFEAMVDFSRQAGKEAGKLFSVRLSIKPPFIAATGKMAKAKTTAAQALLRASQSKAVKAYKATTPLMKAGKNIFGLPIAEEVIKQSKKP